jgi:2-methylisocitrate lyase-like PEP mutase family enzyme
VGANIEDALSGAGAGGPLRDVGERAERITAVREAAGVEAGRCSSAPGPTPFLSGAGGGLTEERAAACAACADGIFVPGAVDPGTSRTW